MIEKILIKNFQAHKKLSVDLDQITTFTGPTDSGKSSVIRALEWVVTNRPLGDSFINDKDEPAFVGIKTNAGKVSRKRGKDINAYTVNKTKLEAFGTDVPEEVKNFLKIEELNFQKQFDQPYWFFVSAGEVSKQLNRIVDLDIIDTTLANLNSKIRNKKSMISVYENKIIDLVNREKELSFVPKMVKEYEKIEQLKSKNEEQKKRLKILSDLSCKASECKKRLITHTNICKDGRRLIKAFNKQETKIKHMNLLKNIIADIKTQEKQSKITIPNINKLVSLSDKVEDLKNKCNDLSDMIDKAKEQKDIIWQTEKSIQSKRKEEKKLIGKTCPLCGSKMK